MDTQSEPGCPIPLTPIESTSPGPAMTEEFPIHRQAKRTRLLPPVPPFGPWSDSEGRGPVPISPISRGPHQDLASDPGDRMDLDETPAPTEPVVTTARPRLGEPSSTEKTNGSHISEAICRTNPKASSGRQEQDKVDCRQDLRSEKRQRRLTELHGEIKKYPKILEEYRKLAQEEREENGEAGQDWPQYQYIYQVGGSEASAQTMAFSKGRNNPKFQRSQSKDRSIVREGQLDRIEEGDQDRMEHGPLTCRTLRNNNGESNHAMRQYVGQSPTDESPMSRLLSSGGAAAVDARFLASAIQDNQGALISPPISVASPQAAGREVSQTHQQRQTIVIPDDETVPAPESGRAQRRNSISTPARPTTNEKSTICPQCGKKFTMPSKLK